MIRSIVYSIGLGLLVFIGGCAVLDAVASVLPTDAHDPETIKETGKQIGGVVSYFWPSVGAVIATGSSIAGHIWQWFRGRGYKEASKTVMQAVEILKEADPDLAEQVLDVIEDLGGKEGECHKVYERLVSAGLIEQNE